MLLHRIGLLAEKLRVQKTSVGFCRHLIGMGFVWARHNAEEICLVELHILWRHLLGVVQLDPIGITIIVANITDSFLFHLEKGIALRVPGVLLGSLFALLTSKKFSQHFQIFCTQLLQLTLSGDR